VRSSQKKRHGPLTTGKDAPLEKQVVITLKQTSNGQQKERGKGRGLARIYQQEDFPERKGYYIGER